MPDTTPARPRTIIHARVEEARRGENPAVIARLRSGWLVMGEHQVVPYYCVLLPDPVVPDLNALEGSARVQYLADMTAVGDTLLRITDARRINYEILGNVEPALHAHVTPRYEWEPEESRSKPQWFYDRSRAPAFDPVAHREIMTKIADALRAGGISVESN